MQLYKAYLDQWKTGVGCAGFSPRLPDYAIRFWLEQLERAYPPAAQRAFLDLGAGDGRLSLLLLRTYSPCGTAIEVQVNKKAWDPIEQRYNRFDLHEGLLQDVMQDLAGKRVYDLIILSEVFEHIPPADVPSFLKLLRELLSDHGRVFLTTPNYCVHGPAEKSYMWHERQKYGHYVHYTYDQLSDIFKCSGFSALWNCFECHWVKSYLYNKWFYRASRIDGKLLNSKKVQPVVRSVYSVVSLPFIFIVRGMAWLVAQIIYFFEKSFSSEKTAGTIVAVFEKQDLAD
jgi:SAM-dependent methyltransferase